MEFTEQEKAEYLTAWKLRHPGFDETNWYEAYRLPDGLFDNTQDDFWDMIDRFANGELTITFPSNHPNSASTTFTYTGGKWTADYIEAWKIRHPGIDVNHWMDAYRDEDGYLEETDEFLEDLKVLPNCKNG